MPETDIAPHFITYNECKLASTNVLNKISEVEKDVDANRRTNEKILFLLQGNGGGGLIEKVNILMLRNTWIDKGFWLVVTILSNLFTLYLTGVLHL